MIEILFDIALLGAVVPAQRLVPDRVVGRGLFAIVVACALMLAAAMLLEPGELAGVLAVPWFIVAGLGAGSRLPGIWARRRSLARLADGLAADVACAFLAVGAAWAVISRFGLQPLGFDERIVLLTAVHFHVAGFVLVLAGELLRRRRPSTPTDLGLAALVVGVPATAAGFLGVDLAALIGAWLVAGGGFVIGFGHIASAVRGGIVLRGRALGVAGAALLLSMPMAAAWATTASFGIGFVSLPVMAAAHGGLNMLGFALPAVYAWRGERL